MSETKFYKVWANGPEGSVGNGLMVFKVRASKESVAIEVARCELLKNGSGVDLAKWHFRCLEIVEKAKT